MYATASVLGASPAQTKTRYNRLQVDIETWQMLDEELCVAAFLGSYFFLRVFDASRILTEEEKNKTSSHIKLFSLGLLLIQFKV